MCFKAMFKGFFIDSLIPKSWKSSFQKYWNRCESSFPLFFNKRKSWRTSFKGFKWKNWEN